MKLLILALVFSPALANAAIQKLKVQGGKVEALAIGSPSFIKIRSEGAAPQGQVEVQDGKVPGAFDSN